MRPGLRIHHFLVAKLLSLRTILRTGFGNHTHITIFTIIYFCIECITIYVRNQYIENSGKTWLISFDTDQFFRQNIFSNVSLALLQYWGRRQSGATKLSRTSNNFSHFDTFILQIYFNFLKISLLLLWVDLFKQTRYHKIVFKTLRVRGIDWIVRLTDNFCTRLLVSIPEIPSYTHAFPSCIN